MCVGWSDGKCGCPVESKPWFTEQNCYKKVERFNALHGVKTAFHATCAILKPSNNCNLSLQHT